MLPRTENLTAYRGDTWEHTFPITGDDGLPVDLTGYAAACEARRQGAVTVLTTVIDDPPTDGKVTISMPAPAPPPGTYWYDVELAGPNGTPVTTWVRGQLAVERDVTNEQPDS